MPSLKKLHINFHPFPFPGVDHSPALADRRVSVQLYKFISMDYEVGSESILVLKRGLPLKTYHLMILVPEILRASAQQDVNMSKHFTLWNFYHKNGSL
jgi:hypothetical protein